MALFNEEILNEIHRKNDIVDVVSRYVSLKRKGRNYFGLCPFHNEKSPSFSVSPDKQIFHCFGCGVGGDVINFVKNIENITFLEAVKDLAESSGIKLLDNENSDYDRDLILKNKILKINESAAIFFHENLYKQTAKIAQEYVKKRKLDQKTLKSFLIGYAPTNNELLAHLKKQGFTEKEMLLSSLIGKTEKGILYDKFKNRLMFPIRDERGKFIAFGGRVFDDSKPKYINSPENLVYSKGRNLFGLNVAKSENRGILKEILVVEGYMDIISLYQRGITGVVASLGTALTDSQARLLRKNCEKVILGYDSDDAGIQAATRAIDILRGLNIDCRVMILDSAKDPDEYIIKYGVDKFRWALDKSISAVEFKIRNLKKDFNLENINDKINFLVKIAEILANVDSSIERELYISKISDVYKISKEAIMAEIIKKTGKKENIAKNLERKTNQKKSEEPLIADENTRRTEALLIYFLINYRADSYLIIKEIFEKNLIKIEKNKKILEILIKSIEEKRVIENITNLFEEDNDIAYITGILSYDFEISDKEKALGDIEKIYKKEEKINERDQILKKLSENSENMDMEEKKNLEKRLNDVILEIVTFK